MLHPRIHTLLLLTATLLPCAGAASADKKPAVLDSAAVARVAASKYWNRLLHVHPASFFRGNRSTVDGKEFFFSPVGHLDAKAELRATVEAFEKNLEIGKLKQHPQCAFPERYRYLKIELKLAITDVPCPKLEEYLAKFNARSATLVFSSAYPNNPGSMFGHTFLRINSQAPGEGEKLDLLDQGISFAAAVPDDENGLAFAMLGLAGGYPGQFAMVPYYAKVGEYINSESRDIWEYDLALDREETLRMLRHAWEIETNSYFDYYFLDENCAYQLLALLEVAKPDWNLLDFPMYVIPAETIKKLIDIPGAVTGIKFRPSLRKKMVARVDALSPEDREEYFRLIRGGLAAESAKNAAVLDAALAFFFYEKQKASGKLTPEQDALLRAARIRRAQFRVPADESMMVFAEDSRPDFGHFPTRLGTSTGVFGSRLFQDLSFKISFHDVMNQDTGYIPFSQIDFPGITLRYLPADGSEKARFRLEKFQALALTSLFPVTFVEKRTSWKLELSWTTPKDLGCDYCRAVHFDGGAGGSLGFAAGKGIAYALAMGNIETGGDAFRKGYRFGPKLQVATLFVPEKNSKLRVGWNWIGDIAQSDRQRSWHELEFDQSYQLNRSWELRSSWLRVLRTEKRAQNASEAKLTLNHYF